MEIKRIGQVLMCVAALGIAAPVFSESAPAISLSTGSVLWLVGDSTMHPFTSRTSELVLSAELDPPGTTGDPHLWDSVLQHGALKQMRLTIPVKTLKSKESALDKNMYKALKAEDYPDIAFRLAHYEVAPSTASAGAARVTASGTLKIAGQEQPVVLRIDSQPEGTTLRLQGEYTLQMTDYGVKPPTMMMGTIKVKNPVVIHFDLRLK